MNNNKLYPFERNRYYPGQIFRQNRIITSIRYVF